MGRPKRGALSSFDASLADKIKQIRGRKPGWGADSIVDELISQHGIGIAQLPSVATINRFLQEQGLMMAREPKSILPNSGECGQKAGAIHEAWQMDAQGATLVEGLSCHAMINIKDVYSKVHCMAFPVPVKNTNSQPARVYYQWALRMAFSQWGLPMVIKVDKDSVFIDNKSSSPFPSLLHLWLIGLNVELCFIKHAPPQENALIERSHQIIERQVIRGQTYSSWQELWQYCQQRCDRLNRFLPNRMLSRKAPLEYYPEARHSGRQYCIEQEQKLFNMQRVYEFLARCTWFRKVSKGRTVVLGGKTYYLSKGKPQVQVQITFCMNSLQLVFRDINDQIIDQKSIRQLSCQDIMQGRSEQLLETYNQLKSNQHCPIKT